MRRSRFLYREEDVTDQNHICILSDTDILLPLTVSIQALICIVYYRTLHTPTHELTDTLLCF